MLPVRLVLLVLLTFIASISAAESTERSQVSTADSASTPSIPSTSKVSHVATTSGSELASILAPSESVDRSPTDLAARKEWLRKKIAEAPEISQVFHPQGDYPKDKVTTHTLKNAPVSLGALVLANYTGKEVFVSTAVRARIVPDVVAEGTPAELANSIIEKLKEAGVSVVEVGPYTIALVEIPKNWSQPAIIIR